MVVFDSYHHLLNNSKDIYSFDITYNHSHYVSLFPTLSLQSHLLIRLSCVYTSFNALSLKL